MTIGIKLDDEEGVEEGFWLYIDSVVTYTKSMRGTVTKNPIAGGKVITDHYVQENPTFSLKGVFSFADISSAHNTIRDEYDFVANNAIEQPEAVTIQQSTSKYLNFLPNSIGQFLPKSSSGVTVAPDRTNYKTYVSLCLERLMSGEVLNKQNNKLQTRIRPIKLYEFVDNALDQIIYDVCLTQYTVTESVDSGDALVCDLQFEQVKFVQLKTTALPGDVVSSLKGKATTKQKKGAVDSTVQKGDSNNVDKVTPDEEDKLTEAVRNRGR